MQCAALLLELTNGDQRGYDGTHLCEPDTYLGGGPSLV